MNEIAENNTDTITRLHLKNREIILLGTAHVSADSVVEVQKIITEEKPDHICVELDASRYKSMTSEDGWSKMNIREVLRQKKGFLMLANLALSSFQKKVGMDSGIKPGEDMKQAVETAKELHIPFSFSDREIHVTLKRAWKKSSLWGKNKLLAALIGSIFSKEEVSKEEIESLKKKSELDGMMDELANYLPAVKEVLIDERDQFLAAKIYQAPGKKVIAVIGAGHAPGIQAIIEAIEEGQEPPKLEEISVVPKPGIVSKSLPWIIPIVICGIIAAGFIFNGREVGLDMIKWWIILNGGFAAIGSIIALAHPLTIILSFLAAPITSMNPTIGVGIVTGILESVFKKPKVKDFENLQKDITSAKGFFKNRITHILIVFFLSSLGSSIGTFVGIAYLPSLFGG